MAWDKSIGASVTYEGVDLRYPILFRMSQGAYHLLITEIDFEYIPYVSRINSLAYILHQSSPSCYEMCLFEVDKEVW